MRLTVYAGEIRPGDAIADPALLRGLRGFGVLTVESVHDDVKGVVVQIANPPDRVHVTPRLALEYSAFDTVEVYRR